MDMTFDEHRNRWRNKHVDVDGIYPDQCMDLMHQYVVDVLGITDLKVLAAPSAYLLFTNFESLKGKEYFERITNTPTAVPQKGDIVIWGTKIGSHGHVAVFVTGNVHNFTSWDANWPVGSLPHEQFHENYNGVLGWLRAKQAPSQLQDTMMQIGVKERDFLVGRSTVAKEVAQFLSIDDPDNAPTEKYKNSVNGIRSRETEARTSLAKEEEEHAKTKQELDNRTEQTDRLKDEVLEATKREQSLTDQIKRLGQNQADAIKVYQEQLRSITLDNTKLAQEKGAALNKAAEWEAKYNTVLKTGKVQNQTVWEFIQSVLKMKIG